MACAQKLPIEPFGTMPEHSDLLYNGLQIAIRRADGALAFKIMNTMYTFNWKRSDIKTIVLCAVAANVGFSNPVLFSMIETSDPSTITIPEPSGGQMDEHEIENCRFETWMSQVSAWIEGNESLSLTAMQFHELSTALLCNDNEYSKLHNRPVYERAAWAVQRLTRSIQLVNHENVRASMLPFAYLLYNDPTRLATILRTCATNYSFQSLSDEWVNVVVSALRLVERKPVPMFFTYLLILLFARDEFTFDEQRVIRNTMTATPPFDRTGQRIAAWISTVPHSVWDITTTGGRARSADYNDFLSESLYTVFEQVRPNHALDWIDGEYRFKLAQHYQRQIIRLSKLWTSLRTLFDNTQKKLTRKRGSATAKQLEEQLEHISGTSDNFEAHYTQHYAPFYDAIALNSTLAALNSNINSN
jgi:hypothetical protein